MNASVIHIPGVSEMAAIVGINTHNSSGFMAE
jgi:hypothetical protein